MCSMRNIREIIDLESFQKIQDDVAKATNSSIITVDDKGVPVTNHSRCSEYCKLIRNKKEFSKLCEKCDSKGGLEAAREGKFYIYKCHRGLVDVAVPIMFEEVYLGSVMVGQVLLDDEDHDIEKVLIEKFEYEDEEKEKIEKAYAKLTRCSYENIKSIAEMLVHLSKYMVEEAVLKETQNEIYRKNIEIALAEKEKLKLEEEYNACHLKALQAQINPHFLFNVLNSIASLTIIEDAPKTGEVIYNLSSILRYTLKKADKLVKLEEEMNYIKSYLEIQKIRFEERLTYNLEIDDEIKENKIPFLAIQVFVENAVIHGIEECENGGCVNVSAKSYGKFIEILIEDNGVGIGNKKLSEIRDELSNKQKVGLDKIGINNANKRMGYYFGENYKIDIKSDIKFGTLVRISIPKINK